VLTSQPFIVEQSAICDVVRDDLIDGGTKLRFLPDVVGDADHIVFGAPFCGGAPVALSVLGRETGKRITIFYAQRKHLTPRMMRVRDNGADIVLVPYGYMGVVQRHARDYAQENGALFLPLGFDVVAAEQPFREMLRAERPRLDYDEIWCATGSGMLARNLGAVFKDSRIMAVAVGLSSRWTEQTMTPNVTIINIDTPYATPVLDSAAPFPICAHYEAKAYRMMAMHAELRPQVRRLFWNVIGA